jgi:alpha-ribazole phosphatase/probable phosphoglycerate mutase
VLVRHAQPAEEAHGRCYGSLDIGLSAAGYEQTRLLARALRPVALRAVYTSPRRRATETAAPLAACHRLVPISEDALREIDFGAFEGRSYDELRRGYPGLYRQWMETPTAVQFPGGESYSTLRTRALAAMESIRTRHLGETVAVVSHGGVLRAMLAACLVMDDAAVFRLEQSHAAVSIVDWIETVPLVRLLNAQAAMLVATPSWRSAAELTP